MTNQTVNENKSEKKKKKTKASIIIIVGKMKSEKFIS